MINHAAINRQATQLWGLRRHLKSPQLSNIEHLLLGEMLPDFPGKCGMWQPANFAKHPLPSGELT